MKNNYIFLIIILVMSSCKKQGGISEVKPLDAGNHPDNSLLIKNNIPFLTEDLSKIRVVNVPTESNTTFFYAEELIDDYYYIPLETTDESLIGEIEKMEMDSSFLFVFDKNNNAVLRFATNGKFLGRISKCGRGPNEYVSLQDMSIDRKKKQICLLDLGGRKLLFFDYAGNIKQEIPLYFYYMRMEFDDSQCVAYTSIIRQNIPAIDMCKIITMEHDQQPKAGGFIRTEAICNNFNYEISHPLMENDGDVYFNYILSDTIWQIKKDKSIARYVIKFPKRDNKFSTKDFQNITSEEYLKKKHGLECDFFNPIITQDFLMFFIDIKNQYTAKMVYCNKTGNIKWGVFTTKEQCGSFGAYFFNKINFSLGKNWMAAVVSPIDMQKRIDFLMKERNRNLSSFKEKDQLVLKHLNSEDNPIIVMIKLKDF